jgi:predicted ester cyclase
MTPSTPNTNGAGSHRQQLLLDFLREVWSDGQVGASARYLAPSYTIHHDPGDPWVGQTLDVAGFERRLSLSRAPFPDQRFDVQALFENRDAVVATWTWSATHQGDLPGFAATGRSITMSGATVYYFDADDRLTGHWQIADRLGVFQQLQAAKQSRSGQPGGG